jgi:hypothetical protein
MLMHDHFAKLSIYPPHIFRRQYQMCREMFVKIVELCEANYYFLLSGGMQPG